MILVDLRTNNKAIVLSNINYDMSYFYDQLVLQKGAKIINFEKRGGLEGLVKEFNQELEKKPYLSPLHIAAQLLDLDSFKAFY